MPYGRPHTSGPHLYTNRSEPRQLTWCERVCSKVAIAACPWRSRCVSTPSGTTLEHAVPHTSTNYRPGRPLSCVPPGHVDVAELGVYDLSLQKRSLDLLGWGEGMTMG